MQQDYTYDLEPGGREFITIGEVDFIYIKAADRPVILTVDGYSQVMEVNDKTRSETRFSRFELENTDPDLPLRVTIVAGIGDYTTQSIKGQLNVVPSIIKANGEIVADDRFYVDLNISPSQQFTTLNVDAGEIITRQLINSETAESDDDYPVAGGFAGGVLAGRDMVNSGGGGWGIDLAFYTLAGEEQEVRRLAFPSPIRFFRAKTIADIDGEYFFMAGEIDYDLDSKHTPSVVLCRWANGSATVIGTAPLFQGIEPPSVISDSYRSGCGIHYDQDSKTLWLAYNDWSLTDVRVHQLAYNDALQTLSETTTYTVDVTGTSDPDVACIGRIDGQLLAVLTPGNGGTEPFLVDLADGSLVWESTFQALSAFQTTATALFQIGAYAYTVEGLDGSPHRTYLAKRWAKTTTYNFSGRVQDRAEACFSGLFKPGPPVYSEAAVEAVNVGGHRFRLEGEVIRAALELFFGRQIVPEYLDAIFGVEIQDTASLPRWFKQYTGNASFRRAGQADDFSILVPGTLRLYVDSTFWSLAV